MGFKTHGLFLWGLKMKRLTASGYFLVILAALGFSFKSILTKLAYGYGVDAMTLMLMRVFIALPFILVTLFFIEGKRAFRITVREILLFAFMGIVGLGCAMLFSFYSLELMDASLSVLVVFTYPALTVLMLILLVGEKATPSKLISLVVTFIGLTMAVRADQSDFFTLNAKGVVFALTAALCFAIYNAMSERALKGISPIRLISYCMVFLVGFFGFFFGNRPYPDSIEVWGIATLLGIFTGFMPFVFFIYGVKSIGA